MAQLCFKNFKKLEKNMIIVFFQIKSCVFI
jgi:hypothetical protein